MLKTLAFAIAMAAVATVSTPDQAMLATVGTSLNGIPSISMGQRSMDR